MISIQHKKIELKIQNYFISLIKNINKMAVVDIKINSVDFVCDWKYNSSSVFDRCCFCDRTDRFKPRSLRNKCSLQMDGVVLSKCGHHAHFQCYKNRLHRNNKYGVKMTCDECQEDFVLERHLEKSHTQKLYKM